MATKTFNPKRIGGGTISLEYNATTGQYSLKETGFDAVNELTIPDFSKITTTTPAKTEDPKTATDLTGTGVAQQTQQAFKIGDRDDDKGNIKRATIDKTTGDSLIQKAKDTSAALNLVDAEDVNLASQKVFAPTEKLTMQGRTRKADSEVVGTMANELKLEEPKVETQKIDRTPRFLRDVFGKPVKKEISTTRPAGIDAPMKTGTAVPDAIKEGQPAIDEAPFDPKSFEGVSEMGALAGVGEKGNVVEQTKQNILIESANTALKSIGEILTSGPLATAVKAIARPETPTDKHAKQYFDIFTSGSNEGRIATNPATSLYGGMNAVSAFGNLEKAGEKRLAKRKETEARREREGRPVSDKFKQTTKNMEKEQANYKASLDKNVTTKREAAIMSRPGGGGDKSGRSGGKIVCTMMNESYGFGSFRNKIWLRHSKNLAPEYQIGYHRIFLPLVKLSKKNKIIKKILEHIAIHRTIDIRQEERNKVHLTGRLYRKILEPICYWVGKI
jgi:hypothetical protein